MSKEGGGGGIGTIWVLASTRALLKKKKKKKLKKKKKKLAQTNSPHHYLTVGFYCIKKYCSYQKLWLFSCDFLPAPIYVEKLKKN